jgi:hypothetical protein
MEPHTPAGTSTHAMHKNVACTFTPGAGSTHADVRYKSNQITPWSRTRRQARKRARTRRIRRRALPFAESLGPAPSLVDDMRLHSPPAQLPSSRPARPQSLIQKKLFQNGVDWLVLSKRPMTW